MILSNFIRRNGKRKGKKTNLNESRFESHQQSPSVSSQAVSPPVFDIHERFSISSTVQSKNSLLVELDLSASNEEWFPQELLQSRSCSPWLSVHRAQTCTAAQSSPMQDTHADSPGAPSRSQSQRASSVAVASFRKKSIPAPLTIPDLAPNTETGRSDKSAEHALEASRRDTKDPSMNSFSPSASDDLSEISGATLARLISSSFVFSSSERQGSRHRSVVRQDSATLPRGEPAFPCHTGRSSPIPPVPRVPTVLVNALSNPNYPSATKSGESAQSDPRTTYSEMTIDSAIPRRMFRIQEIPSPTLSTATRTSPGMTPKKKAGSLPSRPVLKDGVFDVPTTALEVLLTGSEETTRHPSQEETSPGPDDHSLDEYDFVAPGYLHGDSMRGQRKRMLSEANLPRKYSKKNPPIDLALFRHPGDSRPSAAMSEHDYAELLDFDLTLSYGSPELSHSSHAPSSGSAQTFPETPMVYSPLWSPAYALLAKSDNLLRRHSQTPKSADLRSAKLYSSTRATRRQLDKNRVVLRRSRSSMLPIQKMPSPKQARMVPSTFAKAKEEVGITKKTNTSSTAGVELENATKLQSGVRRHPLAHISTSSSYLLEEEALQALAKDSASSLSSISALSLIVDASLQSPTSVHLPASPAATSSSPAFELTEAVVVPSSSASPSQFSPTTIVVSQSHLSKSPLSCPHSWGSSFLPSPSPPVSLNELPLKSPSPIPIFASSRTSDASMPQSFFPPPPYHTVVSERTPYYPGSVSSPSSSQVSPSGPAFQRDRQASSASSQSCPNMRTRARRRPPLPMGPRKPSGPGLVLGSFVRSRYGSVPSVGSGDGTGKLWRKLQSVISEPPPKFHAPPPKWRGLTLEAAQWTFTSEQLQRMVSQAIQQSSEGSSLRLLRLEVLDGEIADEVHRLELQHTDVKAQYKTLVRKRWELMGTLASYIEGETTDGTTASRVMQELADVLLALDQLADKMHDIVLQLSQLKSLRDVHNASALALAVRKINGVFVRQMAEKERLQEEMDALETDRDEAWQHAANVAQDYDTLNERLSEGVWAMSGAAVAKDSDNDARSLKDSRRSTRISAVRKSSIYRSQAGLRSSSRPRSVRSSMSATRPTSPAVDIPPVPPLPRNASINSATGTAQSLGKELELTDLSLAGLSHSSYGTTVPGTSDALALAQAQREVYEMLGLSLPPSRASSRRRTVSWGLDFPKPPPFSSRPMSASLETRRRQVRDEYYSATKRRAIRSVVLDDRPPVGLNRFSFL